MSDLIYTSIPVGHDKCPCCTGTGRISATDYQYKNILSGYDTVTDTLPCNNCGGQYMFGKNKGHVKLNKDGVACTHKYSGKNSGRCLTTYICDYCDDRYQIDSGD